MKKSWVQGLESDAAKEMRGFFTGSTNMRKRLTKLLKDKEEEAYRTARSKEGYECPNWAYKQADLTGYTRALNDIISLIEN